MKLFITALFLLVIGIILICMGWSNVYYGKLFADGEEFEGTVVELKRTISSASDLICPVVEYSFEGRLIKAHHFTSIISLMVLMEAGDTVTIIVNPRKPKLFRAKDFDIEEMVQNSTMIFRFGALFAAVGAVGLAITLIF